MFLQREKEIIFTKRKEKKRKREKDIIFTKRKEKRDYFHKEKKRKEKNISFNKQLRTTNSELRTNIIGYNYI